ncbi:MAG TPA: CBS domain-containing protein [Candidatus Acidoferrales bacterium]
MIHATELLRAKVYDAQGNFVGRVNELFVNPSEQSDRIARFGIDRGKYQRLLARYEQVAFAAPGTLRLNVPELALETFSPNEGWLAVRKDLLDQQIIDINGRKVVRVNDVVLSEQKTNGSIELRLTQVDVGLTGALGRLLQGMLAPSTIRKIQERMPVRVIPWDYVNLIETDPKRRVKLKISHARLAQLHPADIADIIEELAPADRGAVVEALDEETAAEALSEVEPRVQARILETLDRQKAGDILEEMEADEAADMLAGLPAETSNILLKELSQEDAQEVRELLQFEESSAGGLMTTSFVAVPEELTVADAVARIRESQVETDALDTLFLIDSTHRLFGAVPVARMLLAAPETVMSSLRQEQLIFAEPQMDRKEVITLFNKYNLHMLPIVDEAARLVGVVTVDDVLSMLIRTG